jgi:hypothetical protein
LDQDRLLLMPTGPGPGPYTYTLIGSPAVAFDTQSGNPAAGTLLIYQTAMVNLITPHPATTITATVSLPGSDDFVQSIAVPARDAPSGTVEFTRSDTSGTWTIPPGVTSLRITVVGGGGGGAPGSEKDPYWSGGGGGGGGGILQTTLNVMPGNEIRYQVGAGGPGTGPVGSSPIYPGYSGTQSYVEYLSTYYRADGGQGGGTSGGISRQHWNTGGAGGSPGGTAGNPGQSQRGENANRNLMPGGSGGSASPYGFGGNGATGVPQGGTPTDTNTNGQPGTGYGSGGGGGAGGKNNAPQGQGAAGSGGYIKIEWG